MNTDSLPLIRTLTMPCDANLNGGIFGGWILSELDKAAGLLGMRIGEGACSTVAVDGVRFLSPLRVGEDFRIFGEMVKIGRTSMTLRLEGWVQASAPNPPRKVVEATFVSVAIDDQGRPRRVPQLSAGLV